MVSLNLHLHPSHNHNQHNTDIHPYTHKHIITPPHTHEQYEMDSAACMYTYMNGYVCINNKEDEGMDFKRQVRNTKEIYIHICIYFRNNHPVNWENKKLLQVFRRCRICNLSQTEVLFVVSTVRMKTIHSDQTVQVPENARTTLKGYSYYEGSQEREFNHMNVKQYLLRTKRRGFV